MGAAVLEAAAAETGDAAREVARELHAVPKPTLEAVDAVAEGAAEGCCSGPARARPCGNGSPHGRGTDGVVGVGGADPTNAAWKGPWSAAKTPAAASGGGAAAAWAGAKSGVPGAEELGVSSGVVGADGSSNSPCSRTLRRRDRAMRPSASSSAMSCSSRLVRSSAVVRSSRLPALPSPRAMAWPRLLRPSLLLRGASSTPLKPTLLRREVGADPPPPPPVEDRCS